MNTTSVAFLVLSMVALAVGPLLSLRLHRRHWFWSSLEGFILFSVGGFVFLDVLPHAFEKLGWWSFLVAMAGFLAPIVLGKLRSVTQHRAQTIALVLALVGLLLHAILDGVALGMSTSSNSGFSSLAMAVVLHRLPMGLAIWLLVRSLLGTRAALATLGLIGAGTVIGCLSAGYPFALLKGTGVAVFQALVGGMLLHVLLHHPTVDEEEEEPVNQGQLKWAEFVGAALGLLCVVLSSDALGGGVVGHAYHNHAHAHSHANPSAWAVFGKNLLSLSLVSAPALLLGYLLAGLLPVLFPRASLSWLRRGSSVGQVSRGVVFGLPLPICSCGVVPLYQGLIQRGVPATAAMGFLVATPELGVESLILSFPLLGGTMTGMRLASAFVVAMAVGWFVGRKVPMPEAPKDEQKLQPESSDWKAKSKRVLRTGLVEILDDTAPWILVGLVVAAVLQPASITSWLNLLPAGLDVLFFALVGIPLYVCASGATPLAAALIFAGVSPGAAIAFLLVGPATNITTFGVLSRIHSKKIAVWFGFSVIVMTVGLGYLTNYLVGAKVPVPLHNHAHESGNWLQWTCLAVLAVAFLLSALRLGVRGFLLSVFSLGKKEEEEHDHEHREHTHAEETQPTPSTSGCCKCSTEL